MNTLNTRRLRLLSKYAQFLDERKVELRQKTKTQAGQIQNLNVATDDAIVILAHLTLQQQSLILEEIVHLEDFRIEFGIVS